MSKHKIPPNLQIPHAHRHEVWQVLQGRGSSRAVGRMEGSSGVSPKAP